MTRVSFLIRKVDYINVFLAAWGIGLDEDRKNLCCWEKSGGSDGFCVISIKRCNETSITFISAGDNSEKTRKWTDFKISSCNNIVAKFIEVNKFNQELCGTKSCKIALKSK